MCLIKKGRKDVEVFIAAKMKTLHNIFIISCTAFFSILRTLSEWLKYLAEVKVPRRSEYHQNTRFLVGRALEALSAFFLLFRQANATEDLMSTNLPVGWIVTLNTL